MTTAAIREELIDQIRTADDAELNAIYAIVNNGTNDDYIPKWQQQETLRRLKTLEDNPGSGLDWETGMDIINELCK